MGRFISLVLFLAIAGGVLLHREIELPPFGSWIGQLPGDLIIKKGNIAIFLPFTSSVLVSGALSMLSWLFLSKKN